MAQSSKKPTSEAERRLGELLESAPDAIFEFDSDGRIVLLNRMAEQLFGYTRNELMGRTVEDLVPEHLRGAHVGHRSSYMQHPVTRPMGASLKLEARRKDGSHFPVEISLSPGTGDRVTAIVRDLTERLQIERRFAELLDSAPDAILELDAEGRILILNRMAERLFGYTRDELLGKTVDALVPEGVRATHHQHRTRYFNHPVTRPMGAGLNLEARRKDGSHFPVEISLSPTKSDFGMRVIAIIRDITERKQMEGQLRNVQEKYIAGLELRNQESEQANRLKTEFLSNMSHELRSPLHTIIGFAELLAEQTAGPLNDTQQRFVSHVHRDSLHLLDLINDLLDLSKIEAGRVELQRQPLSIAWVLEDAVASVRPRAEAKSLLIRAEHPPSISIFADRLRIKQILHNLLTNAVKFTPKGGQITISSVGRETLAEISVTDTGIGIPDDQHQAVFDKFFQVQATAKGEQQGTGLGLAITKRLVEQHGGTIWLRSEPGKGSCFTFSIPLS
ncbi:MAG TPA: PAS domain-containing sensor histidine kinase [Bryobacteraceae bacterium]|nr:PAS domain-containing sensor histidine kinase [Bryobacteraceae bacterium]